MSTYYGFRCKTCGLHIFGTRNNVACLDVLLIAPYLKVLLASRHSNVLDIRFESSILWDGWDTQTQMENDPFQFVAEHCTHGLVVISEYGEQYTGETTQ